MNETSCFRTRSGSNRYLFCIALCHVLIISVIAEASTIPRQPEISLLNSEGGAKRLMRSEDTDRRGEHESGASVASHRRATLSREESDDLKAVVDSLADASRQQTDVLSAAAIATHALNKALGNLQAVTSEELLIIEQDHHISPDYTSNPASSLAKVEPLKKHTAMLAIEQWSKTQTAVQNAVGVWSKTIQSLCSRVVSKALASSLAQTCRNAHQVHGALLEDDGIAPTTQSLSGPVLAQPTDMLKAHVENQVAGLHDAKVQVGKLVIALAQLEGVNEMMGMVTQRAATKADVSRDDVMAVVDSLSHQQEASGAATAIVASLGKAMRPLRGDAKETS